MSEEINGSERLIQEYNKGVVTFEEVMLNLINTHVFILLDKLIEEQNDGNLPPMAPLTFNNVKNITHIAVCTSKRLAKIAVYSAPTFEYAFEILLGWFLQNIKDGLGILFNPNTDFTLEITPEKVKELREQLRQSTVKE